MVFKKKQGTAIGPFLVGLHFEMNQDSPVG